MEFRKTMEISEKISDENYVQIGSNFWIKTGETGREINGGTF